jgi:hypothetical protein
MFNSDGKTRLHSRIVVFSLNASEVVKSPVPVLQILILAVVSSLGRIVSSFGKEVCSFTSVKVQVLQY